MSPFENRDTKEDTPQLTDKLTGVLSILPLGEEEQTRNNATQMTLSFFGINSDDDSEIDNIV